MHINEYGTKGLPSLYHEFPGFAILSDSLSDMESHLMRNFPVLEQFSDSSLIEDTVED